MQRKDGLPRRSFATPRNDEDLGFVVPWTPRNDEDFIFVVLMHYETASFEPLSNMVYL